MNKDYKNFFGGLDSDVDIDSSKDFVNQGGTWSDIQETINQYGGESSDTLEDLNTKIEQAGGGNVPTGTQPSVQDALEERRKAIEKANKKANRGKGIGSFAQGLSRGLGLLQSPTTTPPQGTGQPPPQTAGYGLERRNPVIPILIGLIGVSVLLFAISKSKKGKESSMPMPTS